MPSKLDCRNLEAGKANRNLFENRCLLQLCEKEDWKFVQRGTLRAAGNLVRVKIEQKSLKLFYL